MSKQTIWIANVSALVLLFLAWINVVVEHREAVRPDAVAATEIETQRQLLGKKMAVAWPVLDNRVNLWAAVNSCLDIDQTRQRDTAALDKAASEVIGFVKSLTLEERDARNANAKTRELEEQWRQYVNM